LVATENNLVEKEKLVAEQKNLIDERENEAVSLCLTHTICSL
jgi:hypothetical protein